MTLHTDALIKPLIWVTLVLSTGAILPVVRNRMMGTSGDTGDPLQQGIWLVLLGVFVFLGVLRWPTLWATLRLNPLLILLHLFALLSVVWSIDRGLTFRRSVAVVLTAWLGVYLAAVFKEREVFDLLANALAFVTISSLVVALAMPTLGVSQDPFMFGAWQGVFVHKNMLGLAAGFTCVVWFVRLLHAPRSRIVSFLVFAASAFVLVQADSQTSLLVTVITLALVLCFPLLKYLHQGLMGGLVIAASILIPLGMFLVLSNLDEVTASIGRDTTFTGRTILWSEAWDKVIHRPTLGYGFDSFWRGMTGPSADVVVAMRGFSPLTAHNGILETALDLGVLGLAPFILLLIMCIFEMVLELRRGVTLGTAFLSSFIVFFLMYNVVESTVMQYNAVSWVMFCFATSVLMRRRRDRLSRLRRRRSPRETQRPHLQPPMTSGAV